MSDIVIGSMIFQVAAGTVAGQRHVSLGKNNQDAFVLRHKDEIFVGIVCDGCGDSPYSELGSIMGARMVSEAVLRNIPYLNSIPDDVDHAIYVKRFFDTVQMDVLAQMRICAQSLGGDFQSTLASYFLFSIVGVLMTPIYSYIFMIGDGIYALNEEIVTIGPFPNNAPPYIVYEMLTSDIAAELRPIRFIIYETIPTEEVQSLLVGCDGVCDLVAAEEKHLPDRSELVGSLSQFWTNDRFFIKGNNDIVRRRLAIIGTTKEKIDWEAHKKHVHKGLLNDDTTLVVVRRTPESEK